jgi:hypothetical protein
MVLSSQLLPREECTLEMRRSGGQSWRRERTTWCRQRITPPQRVAIDAIWYIKATIATKENVRAIVREELEPIETRLTSIESEVRSIRRELDDLSEKFDNVSGFRKEIDYALERGY